MTTSQMPEPQTTTPQSSSLQQIVNAWAGWCNKKVNGGGIKYTATTDYQAVPALASDPQINTYMKYQISTSASPAQYGLATTKPGAPVGYMQNTNNNNSPTETVTQTLEFSESTTQTFSWSVTATAEVGVTVTVEASIPEVFKVGGSVTESFSLSSTVGYSGSVQKTWKSSLAIPVPPGKRGVARMFVDVSSGDAPWLSYVTLTGSAAVWFKNKVALNGKGSHNLWFIPITQVFQDVQNPANNITVVNTTGYTIVDGTVKVACGGVFHGQGGYNASSDNGEVPASSPKGTLPAEWSPASPVPAGS